RGLGRRSAELERPAEVARLGVELAERRQRAIVAAELERAEIAQVSEDPQRIVAGREQRAVRREADPPAGGAARLGGRRRGLVAAASCGRRAGARLRLE